DALFFGKRVRHEHSDSRLHRPLNHDHGIRLLERAVLQFAAVIQTTSENPTIKAHCVLPLLPAGCITPKEGFSESAKAREGKTSAFPGEY
ncbi:MAG: hypothetical protein WCP99_20605, partial [Burkholderiales bacterium]